MAPWSGEGETEKLPEPPELSAGRHQAAGGGRTRSKLSGSRAGWAAAPDQGPPPGVTSLCGTMVSGQLGLGLQGPAGASSLLLCLSKASSNLPGWGGGGELKQGEHDLGLQPGHSGTLGVGLEEGPIPSEPRVRTAGATALSRTWEVTNQTLWL